MEIFVFLITFLTLLGASISTDHLPGHKDALHAHFDPSPMVSLQGGQFKMGVNDIRAKPGEHGIKRAEVRPFMIDRYPVTNGDFAKFKHEKKKYYTTSEMSGFSYVFYSLTNTNDRLDVSRTFPDEPWWYPVHGATWFHPEGPSSDIRMRPDHPVVHVSYDDARAFCHWAGKRMVGEHEWEFAARGGLVAARYPWGEHFKRNKTNLWQGLFPMENYVGDGYYGVSPVNAFGPQNTFGMYDMIGNVWEWTNSRFLNLKQPIEVNSRDEPRWYVVKGGSFIDSRDGRFNMEARCAARRGHQPQYTAQNLGFRCAKNYVPPSAKAVQPKPRATKAPRSEPRTHYLHETWNYKLGRLVRFVLLGDDGSVVDPKTTGRQREDL